MTIREQVARSMWADTNYGDGRGGWNRVESITQETYRSNAAVAIETFLEAAAEKGWHMRPDEATEEMLLAGSKPLYTEGRFLKGALYAHWKAMLAAAPEFEWDK